MKHLLFVLCLLLTTAAQAQTVAPPPVGYPVKYCMLYTRGGSISSLSLYLDYGRDQRKELAVQDPQLLALAAQLERFTSIPAALSYLDSAGWELVQAATLSDESTQHYVSSQIGYLLRRRP